VPRGWSSVQVVGDDDAPVRVVVCELAGGFASIPGGGTVPVMPPLLGGYAEYEYLAPDSMVPGGLDLDAGMRWSIMVPGTNPGDVAVTAQAPTAFTQAIAPARPAGIVAVAYRPALDLPMPGRHPCA
jgi:hypothetical protein